MKYVLLSSLGNCQKGSNFYFKNIFISELDILTFLLYHSCVKIKSSLRLLHSLSPRLMERPIRVQSKHLLADLSNIFFFFFLTITYQPSHFGQHAGTNGSLSGETGYTVVEVYTRKSRPAPKAMHIPRQEAKRRKSSPQTHSLNMREPKNTYGKSYRGSKQGKRYYFTFHAE